MTENELTANQGVLVEQVPLPIDQLMAEIKPQPEDHAFYTSALCLSCHASGDDDIPQTPEGHQGYDPENCSTCHAVP